MLAWISDACRLPPGDQSAIAPNMPVLRTPAGANRKLTIYHSLANDFEMEKPPLKNFRDKVLVGTSGGTNNDASSHLRL